MNTKTIKPFREFYRNLGQGHLLSMRNNPCLPDQWKLKRWLGFRRYGLLLSFFQLLCILLLRFLLKEQPLLTL